MNFRRKKIRSELIINYAIFLLTLIITIVISIFMVMALVMDNIYDLGIGVKIEENYKSMDMSYMDSVDGWIEILDENLMVIDRRGKCLYKKEQYTLKELININDDKNYYGIVHAYKDKNGEERISILKYQVKNNAMDNFVTINGINYRLEGELLRYQQYAVIAIIVIIVIGILMFSIYTSKKITNPLKKINKGLSKVIDGDYTEKVEFKGAREFEQLKDKFNYLLKELTRAKEEKKNVEESKKRLMAEMAHDIKTPLTTIQGFSQALAYEELDEKKRKKYSMNIYNKSIQVAGMVDELFQWSKLDRVDYELDLEKKNLSELLRRVIGDFYEDIEEKSMELDIDINGEIYAYIDEKLFDRAIRNLIQNSIKYNINGTKIKISLDKIEEDILLDICDNGIGIDEKLKENIFNPFVRGDESRKSKDGSGLGLAIVKRIIELHKGVVTLESEIAYTTVFRIKF